MKKLSVAPAKDLPARHPGLAFTNRWGLVQTYFPAQADLDPISASTLGRYLGKGTGLVQRALREAGGKMSIPDVSAWVQESGWGSQLSDWKLRKLLKAWELKGWLKKDPERDNARFITAILAEIATNQQTAQTATNPTNRSQSGENPMNADTHMLWFEEQENATPLDAAINAGRYFHKKYGLVPKLLALPQAWADASNNRARTGAGSRRR